MRKIMVLSCFLLTFLSPCVRADNDDIKTTIAACADIMSFDIKDYDYDTLFKYVLYTHENFRVLTDIDPEAGESSTSGYNNISLVSSEFIDYVMNNVFRIAPEKPPLSSLTTRGFCYNNGYYLYTGGFDVYFSTEIKDLISIDDLGSDVLLVTFSDVYREENSSKNEESFAILQKKSNTYSLLRLGMGEKPPSEEEALSYVPKPQTDDGDTKSAGDTKNKLLLPVLLFIFSAGAVGLSCCLFALRRRK